MSNWDGVPISSEEAQMLSMLNSLAGEHGAIYNLEHLYTEEAMGIYYDENYSACHDPPLSFLMSRGAIDIMSDEIKQERSTKDSLRRVHVKRSTKVRINDKGKRLLAEYRAVNFECRST